jgi:two-component system phosphate regulon sensor histidine kinase PhoR
MAGTKGSAQSPAHTRLLLILLALILLPAIFYSAYEISTLSSNENLLEEIYRRQLNTVLFSVNQYAWDAASSWAATIEQDPDGLERFLATTSGVLGAFSTDSSLSTVTIVHSPGGAGLPDSVVQQTLRTQSPLLSRLTRLRTTGYRKLEGLTLNSTPDGDSVIAVLFALPPTTSGRSHAGFILAADGFVRTVLAPRIREAAGNDLAVTVRTLGGRTIFSTGTITETALQERTLWLFPHLTLGIAPTGTTVEDLAHDRFQRNLVLILILLVVLLTAGWVLYRTINQQTELARLRTDFVSNVSHELRTPLALIRMYTDSLEMGRVPQAKQQEYLATILGETERLSRLVNRILNFARMEAGRKPYHLAPLDLNTVAREVTDTYRRQLDEAGFTLTLNLADNLPRVQADREAAAEALINLLDNAIKYSPNEKAITLRTAATDRTATIEVTDRGIGIAPEHHTKIFEKFYRVSGALVHDTKGSGLGLSLVRHIMEAHNGSVTVESAAGSGATFRLVFQRDEAV